MRLLICILPIFLICSCRSLYIGETPVLVAGDTGSRFQVHAGAGNAQLIYRTKPGLLFGVKVDAHDQDRWRTESNFNGHTEQAEIFLGYNFRRKKEIPFYLFAGGGVGSTRYSEGTSDHDKTSGAGLKFSASLEQSFLQIGTRVPLDKRLYLIPTFSFRYVHFLEPSLRSSSNTANPYHSELFWEGPIKLKSEYLFGNQVGLTLLYKYKWVFGFTNINGNMNWNGEYFQMVTTRMGVGINF